MHSDPTFTTSRLFLRPVVEGDVELFLDLDSDPEVMRFINGGTPTTPADYDAGMLDRMLSFRGEPFGFFTAYENEVFVGWFHLRPSVFDDTLLELGYRLKRDAWGRGLATEGSRALVAWAFDELGQSSVDACVMPANRSSKNVLLKVGMRSLGPAVHPRADAPVERFIVDAG